MLKESSKKFTEAKLNGSWDTDTEEFVEHSPSGRSLYLQAAQLPEDNSGLFFFFFCRGRGVLPHIKQNIRCCKTLHILLYIIIQPPVKNVLVFHL